MIDMPNKILERRGIRIEDWSTTYKVPAAFYYEWWVPLAEIRQ